MSKPFKLSPLVGFPVLFEHRKKKLSGVITNISYYAFKPDEQPYFFIKAGMQAFVYFRHEFTLDKRFLYLENEESL